MTVVMTCIDQGPGLAELVLSLSVPSSPAGKVPVERICQSTRPPSATEESHDAVHVFPLCTRAIDVAVNVPLARYSRCSVAETGLTVTPVGSVNTVANTTVLPRVISSAMSDLVDRHGPAVGTDIGGAAVGADRHGAGVDADGDLRRPYHAAEMEDGVDVRGREQARAAPDANRLARRRQLRPATAQPARA